MRGMPAAVEKLRQLAGSAPTRCGAHKRELRESRPEQIFEALQQEERQKAVEPVAMDESLEELGGAITDPMQRLMLLQMKQLHLLTQSQVKAKNSQRSHRGSEQNQETTMETTQEACQQGGRGFQLVPSLEPHLSQASASQPCGAALPSSSKSERGSWTPSATSGRVVPHGLGCRVERGQRHGAEARAQAKLEEGVGKTSSGGTPATQLAPPHGIECIEFFQAAMKVAAQRGGFASFARSFRTPIRNDDGLQPRSDLWPCPPPFWGCWTKLSHFLQSAGGSTAVCALWPRLFRPW